MPIGIEEDMLTMVLNSLKEEELKKLGVRSNGIESFLESLPFKRFSQVSKVNSVGTKSYERLHKYCYAKAIQNNIEFKDESEQLSFFD